MMRLWQGAVGVVPSDGLVSPAYVVAQPRSGTAAKYYTYLLRTSAYTEEINRRSRGIVSDRNRLFWEDFKPLPALCPPRSEQAEIVGYLDAHSHHVNRLVAAKQRLLKLLAEQRQGIVQRAVTRGLNPDVPMKPSGVAWLGEVPAHWEVRRLRQVVRFTGGGTPSKQTPAYWGGDIPWVSPKDMKAERIERTIDTITAEAVQASATSRVPPGSVLVVVRSGILQRTLPVALAQVEVTLNQDMKGLLPSKELLPAFLMRFLQGEERSILAVCSKLGATVESIEQGYFASLAIPLPPLEEQQAIVAHLDAELAEIDAVTAKVRREIDLVREYRTRLVSDVVTGRLDVRGAELPPLPEDDALLVIDDEDDAAQLEDEALDVA